MRLKTILLVLAGLLVLIQFVPVQRTNPLAEQEVEPPPEVQTILETSCYDCHSHRTHWPWYAYVAPVSWLVAHDVKEAREHLNFSRWNRYESDERRNKVEEIWEEVEEGEMPLWYYLPLHPIARLSQEQLTALRHWVEAYDDRDSLKAMTSE